jgi:hypothetical protein
MLAVNQNARFTSLLDAATFGIGPLTQQAIDDLLEVSGGTLTGVLSTS